MSNLNTLGDEPKPNPADGTWSTTQVVVATLIGAALGALAMHLQMKGEEKKP